MMPIIPADLAQFYYNVIQVLQKLVYLYGWPSLTDEESIIDDDTMQKFTLFVGVMLGSAEASKIVSEISKRLANKMMKRLPKQALTKHGFYNVAKQVAKWIGIKMTKETFAKGLSRAIPILGGIINGIGSFLSFKPMAKTLKYHLRNLPLARE